MACQVGAVPGFDGFSPNLQSSQRGRRMSMKFPADWLVEKITVAEAEAAHPGIRDERLRRFPDAARPFGFNNQKWEALKSTMQPGDELWIFCSSAESWKDLAGRRGIVLLRNGQAIAEIVTLMN
jgi:hypothetical protein